MTDIRFILRVLPQPDEVTWGGAHRRNMDDKTPFSLQPSTAFDESSSSLTTTHSPSRPLTSALPYPTTSINAILSGINQSAIMERKNQFDIQNTLMSPPEATPLDSFVRATSRSAMDSKTNTVFVAGRFLPSPPVSPESTTTTTPEDLTSMAVRDPILFSSQDSQGSPSSQPPLFQYDNRRVVDEHVAAREESTFREVSPPRQSEYQLALEFKSQVAQSFNANRRLWQQRELAQLREDNALRPGGRRYTTIAPANPGGRPVRQGPKQPHGSRTNGAKVVKHRTPKPAPFRGATPDAGKRVAREDKDFNSLPDYCPPLSSLPSKPNSLKVDWKGAPIDLKQDPFAYMLHPDEIYLAANLRLDCATYLTSKRRIFIKRIEALRIGKEFRKTDAQQACKIDVNKASKLWQAFEKVGWLDPKFVSQYL